MSTQQGARVWTMAESILVFQDGVHAVGPMIPVIEKAAYDRLAAENAKLRELVKRSKIVIEASIAQKILPDKFGEYADYLEAKKAAGIE